MPFGTATVLTNSGKRTTADRQQTTPTRNPLKFVAMGVGATGAARTAAAADTALSTEVETRTSGTESTVTTAQTGDTYQTRGTISATATRAVDEAARSTRARRGTSASVCDVPGHQPLERRFARPDREDAVHVTVTAEIGGEQEGEIPYLWSIVYDDVTRRVTAQATADGKVAAISVVVQITAGGATSKVQFVRAGRQPDADVDFPVVIGAGPTLIGPSIVPAQVARIVGKIGSVDGGLPFTESWSRV
jgi:hypothetical protein